MGEDTGSNTGGDRCHFDPHEWDLTPCRWLEQKSSEGWPRHRARGLHRVTVKRPDGDYSDRVVMCLGSYERPVMLVFCPFCGARVQPEGADVVTKFDAVAGTSATPGEVARA